MRDLRVAAAQVECGVGALEANLAKHREYVGRAAQAGADFICFPELSLSGYPTDARACGVIAQPLNGDIGRALHSLANETRIVVLAGLLERADSGETYNSQVVAAPGAPLRVYRKTHVPNIEAERFSVGDALPVFRFAKATIGIQICYDAHFPEASAVQALEGAEVLFMPHASAAFEDRTTKRERWMRFLPARAYDNRVFVVAANQVGFAGDLEMPGVTLVLDPSGRVIAEAGANEELIVVDLSAELLSESRRDPGDFFLNVRRPDLYGSLVALKDKGLSTA